MYYFVIPLMLNVRNPEARAALASRFTAVGRGKRVHDGAESVRKNKFTFSALCLIKEQSLFSELCCNYPYVESPCLLSVLSDPSTGWVMTPWGCPLPCLQRTAGDCVQGWEPKMEWCHDLWWCCREESRNKDTAQTQTSSSGRSLSSTGHLE